MHMHKLDEVNADLSSRAVGHSPNVHEAAKQMNALRGFGDLPIGTPGTPTQPNRTLQNTIRAQLRVCKHH